MHPGGFYHHNEPSGLFISCPVMPKKQLHFDIETFSTVSLKDCGVHVYAADAAFEILTVAYSLNGLPVRSFSPAAGEPWPDDFLTSYNDPHVEKWAHNAAFERVCMAAVGLPRPHREWRCTMILAYHCGLPGSLKQLSSVLHLDGAAKSAGAHLINRFCKPCKPAATHSNRTRHRPHHFPDKWAEFVAYCEQDVRAEIAVHARLSKYDLSPFEWDMYALDQRINDYGIPIDAGLAHAAIDLHARQKTLLEAELRALTGIEAIGNTSKLADFIAAQIGRPVPNMQAEYLRELLPTVQDPDARRAIELRQRLSKTSISKYKAMLNCAGREDRARGTIQFYGGWRTGRWAGRRIQPHNMPRNYLPDLDAARSLIRSGDFETVIEAHPDLNSTLSQLTRTALAAPRGRVFVVCDYNAIEARALAWLSGEEWRMEVFRSHGKIYEASAAAVSGVPVEEITKDHPLRAMGKVRELACGYGGSVGAMRKMDFDNILPEDDELVRAAVMEWRAASPNVVRFWKLLNRMAFAAMDRPGRTFRAHRTGITMRRDRNALWIGLPSGRELAYWGPRIGQGRFGTELQYYGTDNNGRWCRENTYGGKLTENIDQAISRDLLADAMQRVEDAGYNIAFHVHDELVIECDEAEAEAVLDDLKRLMAIPPAWAADLPLKGAGFISKYYKK